MNIHKYIITVLFASVLFAFTECSNPTADKPQANKIIAHSSSTDSISEQKNELTKIYTQAINEYIKAVFNKTKLAFDTLYIGKRNYGQPDDFPDIMLPPTIEHTKILLLSNEESSKQKFGKSSAYINMIGSVSADTAEFIFITFYQGFQHNFDCFISYKYMAKQKEFELEKLRFEDYFFNKEGKLERIAIYKDGKYVGDKPIKKNNR